MKHGTNRSNYIPPLGNLHAYSSRIRILIPNPIIICVNYN